MGFLNSSGTKVERNRLFVTNNEGAILPPGTPVYIKSRSNDEILVGMSDADLEETMPSIGITTKRMKVGESADILLGGFIDEIELGGLTAAAVGQTLYVSQTGTLTNEEPTAGTVQSIGTILEVNAAGDTATEALIAFGGAGAGGGGGGADTATATKVKVKLGQSFSTGGVAAITGFDAAEGVPIVSRTNFATEQQAIGIIDTIQNGVQSALNSGDVVDMTINGLVERISFYDVHSDAAPAVGDIVYQYNNFGYGSDAEADYVPLGRISAIETPISPEGNGFISMFANLPEANAMLTDGVMAVDSHRSIAVIYNGDMHIGDVVKIGADSGGGYTNIKRWDPAGGDTPSQIAGVCQYYTDRNGASAQGEFTGVCFSGSVVFEISVFVGTTPVLGDAIYTDATTPYKMTTNPASGIQVGVVILELSNPDRVKILFNAPGSGGGATTGEKLDFTVRSDAYAATGDHEGIDLKIGGAASVTVGLSYYWDGDWNVSDAVLPASGDGLMAMATDTGVGVNMMQKGIIQLAANPTGAVAGSVLYFETSGTGTAGTLTATAPSASGNIVRVAGHAIDAAGLVYFDPSEDWLEIV